MVTSIFYKIMTTVKKFQFIEVDEKNINISYPGVENKGRRPYLVIRANIKQNLLLAYPLSSIESKIQIGNKINNTTKKKGAFWFEYKYKNKSYIKLDQPVLMSNKELGVNIYPISKYLDEGKRKFVLKTIHEFFEK